MIRLKRASFCCAVSILALVIAVTDSMHIPEDMEIMEGYDLESAGTEINPEDDFYEQRSLLEPFFSRAIRDKREVPYRVLESPGLKSHFRQPYYDDDLRNKDVQQSRKRSRRSVEADTVTATEPPKPTEELPNPEKQTLHQRTIEAWGKTPYKVKQPVEEESDSEPEASMMSEGIKARAPRVNFITQKKSHSDSSETREDKVIPELYRKPLARLYYEYPSIPRIYDSFPAHSQSPMYPKIYNKYDEYHRDMMDRMHPPAPHRYDTYYQRRYDTDYDSYFPRYSFPGYYYYPDKRFDVPSYYRDRNYLLTNDVMDPPPIPQIHLPTRNRRIIYYANLPEIVRTPPNVDLRYRNYNKFGNRFDPFYPTKAPMSSYKAPSTSKYDERNPGDRKEDKYVSSTPIKIVREIAAQQESPGASGNLAGRRQYTVNGVGGSSARSNSYSDGDHHDQDRSYFGRYH
ncbi:uncharacterized protein LOC131685236 [Topomyia yanbarensis]|uniref:uncharacterized protein LOC131685236 n=1 Tax=Topomyia yanbarensis TaxID=2498891 RepID=UPI00273C1D3C|nr:uncharacterized protein LOC131685236 [Topomyia yanbarensis]XP_058824806.1 uncharacterized protein LOC131685236 [Topomyia yanbarensis]